MIVNVTVSFAYAFDDLVDVLEDGAFILFGFVRDKFKLSVERLHLAGGCADGHGFRWPGTRNKQMMYSDGHEVPFAGKGSFEALHNTEKVSECFFCGTSELVQEEDIFTTVIATYPVEVSDLVVCVNVFVFNLL